VTCRHCHQPITHTGAWVHATGQQRCDEMPVGVVAEPAFAEGGVIKGDGSEEWRRPPSNYGCVIPAALVRELGSREIERRNRRAILDAMMADSDYERPVAFEDIGSTRIEGVTGPGADR
jgi:hypothetical protein